MNNVNNSLENIKDNIKEELIKFKKEQNEKIKHNYNNILLNYKSSNNNGTQSSKEILSEYFNKIKKSSKLNISHNSIVSNKNNLNLNSLEISEISNFNIDDNKHINDKYYIGNIYDNKNNQVINKQNNKSIIYETFKNSLNKNKNNFTQNYKNNNIIINNDENKIITGRFQNQNKEKAPIVDFKDKNQSDNNFVKIKDINNIKYDEPNLKLSEEYNLISLKESDNINIIKINDKLQDNNDFNNFNIKNNNYKEGNEKKNVYALSNFNVLENAINNKTLNIFKFDYDGQNSNNNLYNENNTNINLNKNILTLNKQNDKLNINRNNIQNEDKNSSPYIFLNEVDKEQISIIKDITTFLNEPPDCGRMNFQILVNYSEMNKKFSKFFIVFQKIFLI